MFRTFRRKRISLRRAGKGAAKARLRASPTRYGRARRTTRGHASLCPPYEALPWILVSALELGLGDSRARVLGEIGMQKRLGLGNGQMQVVEILHLNGE
jgi:hypothetical protein